MGTVSDPALSFLWEVKENGAFGGVQDQYVAHFLGRFLATFSSGQPCAVRGRPPGTPLLIPVTFHVLTIIDLIHFLPPLHWL